MEQRRLPRILPNAAAVVSLVLCLAMIALWVRSYWYVTNLIHVIGPPESYFLGSMDGMLTVSEWNHEKRPRGWELFDARITRPSPPSRAMFVFFGVERGGAPGHRYVSVSWAYPFALATALPLVRLYRASRRRRGLPRAVCPACGYDLRATPDRCPECGTAAAAHGPRSS